MGGNHGGHDDRKPYTGLSLVALTLAACVSSGSPLPDGTLTQQGHVILLAPYDSPTDILKPRLEAAGGDPTHLMLVRPLVTHQTGPQGQIVRRLYIEQGLDIARELYLALVLLFLAAAWPGLGAPLIWDDLHLIRPYSPSELTETWRGPWDPDGVETPGFRPLTTYFNHARASLLGEWTPAHDCPARGRGSYFLRFSSKTAEPAGLPSW